MSKLLPAVLTVTWPAAVGVIFHQTDAPPPLPAWRGSPVSFVADALLPLVVPEAEVSAIALEKALLAGPDVPTVCVQFSAIDPEAAE